MRAIPFTLSPINETNVAVFKATRLPCWNRYSRLAVLSRRSRNCPTRIGSNEQLIGQETGGPVSWLCTIAARVASLALASTTVILR